MDKFKQYLRTITPITDQEFTDSIKYFSPLTLNKGDLFVKQDKICVHIGFIVKGILRTYYINDKGEEVTACFCTENHLTTSFKSFILQAPSQLILQAIEETQLLVIHYNDLQKLYVQYPIYQAIGRLVAEREYIVMEQYASVLNNEPAKEKYLRLLREQPELLHKAKVEDIASYLGVTRRTLSRIRKEIADKS